jgi:DNA-binding MarR family transcriptional regulator
MVTSARKPRVERKSSEGRAANLGQVLEFMRLLWAVAHGLQSTSKHMEAELGITGPQRLTIRIIGRFPGISAGELAEILLVHPSTLTGVLKRLAERGVIVRKPDPEDARRAVLGLTAKGRRIDEIRTGTVEAAVRQALGRLSKAKIDAAHQVLREVASDLTPDHEAEALDRAD